MADMADFALEIMMDEDEAQLNILGTSNVFPGSGIRPTFCERCQSVLIEIKGKFGLFLGCPNFPKCKGTTWSLNRSRLPLSIDDEEQMGRF